MHVLVTGAASGLGKAIADRLVNLGHAAYRVDRNIGWSHDVTYFTEEQLTDMVGRSGKIDALINCAGINTNEWFEDITHESFMQIMDVNAYGIVRMAQACLSRLKKSDVNCIINIVSNAAHIPMTASLAYNASKAAALMITKQMAHELTPKYGTTVLSVSPNKLQGTGMSKQIEANVCAIRGWTPEFAAEYQKKALMHGRETHPLDLADFIADLLDKDYFRYLSGCDLQFGK
jgi:NAD(P)-dependent dehydrogenase (short-subunit alcohol dehydrogenase family)